MNEVKELMDKIKELEQELKIKDKLLRTYKFQLHCVHKAKNTTVDGSKWVI